MPDVTLVMCLSSPPRGNLEAVDKRNDFIDWNEGRDGYVPAPRAVTKAAERQFLLRTRTEELFGTLSRRIFTSPRRPVHQRVG